MFEVFSWIAMGLIIGGLFDFFFEKREGHFIWYSLAGIAGGFIGGIAGVLIGGAQPDAALVMDFNGSQFSVLCLLTSLAGAALFTGANYWWITRKDGPAHVDPRPDFP